MGRAGDVGGDQAEASLLVESEWSGWCDRGAAVIARDRAGAPRAVRRQQIRARHNGTVGSRGDTAVRGLEERVDRRVVGHQGEDSASSAGRPERPRLRSPPPGPGSVPGPGRTKSWRRPIFPKGCPLSIFGAGELDFRVRDGNGYGLSARVTRILLLDVNRRRPSGANCARGAERSRDRSISRVVDLSRSPAADPGSGAGSGQALDH